MVWRWLRHPNIVYFLGVSTFFDLSLVSIWMSHGNVQTYLKNNPKSNRSKLVRMFESNIGRPMLTVRLKVRDIILGLDYLHSINIIHGDLKAVSREAEHTLALLNYCFIRPTFSSTES